VEKRLEDQLKRLPAKPGVYIFRDARGQVLYVGKAKSLRPRVRSYFQASADVRHAIAQLPERVADIEVIVTGTEVERRCIWSRTSLSGTGRRSTSGCATTSPFRTSPSPSRTTSRV